MLRVLLCMCCNLPKYGSSLLGIHCLLPWHAGRNSCNKQAQAAAAGSEQVATHHRQCFLASKIRPACHIV
jgi:hypothetical protein